MHADAYVVGDLSRDDCQEFFDNEWLRLAKDASPPKPAFDRVYDVFGGRMLHVTKLLEDYIAGDRTVERMVCSFILFVVVGGCNVVGVFVSSCLVFLFFFLYLFCFIFFRHY